jgi:hypothetical protein
MFDRTNALGGCRACADDTKRNAEANKAPFT